MSYPLFAKGKVDMQDINGVEIQPGQFLLHKITTSGVAHWRIRKIEEVDQTAGTIRFSGPNLNPADKVPLPTIDKPINYSTSAVPHRFLLVLDPRSDKLYSKEHNPNTEWSSS
jgi:hypothetical protein